MVTVSVVVPCYNQGKYLEETVDSVLQSTFKDLEIIVINDGSTDPETVKIIQSFSRPQTTVIHQNNLGISAARNNAIRLAKGKYILALDSDDKIHPEYIAKAIQVFAEKPEVSIVYSRAEYFGDKKGEYKLPDYELKSFLNCNCILVGSIYRKSDWEKVGGYKPVGMEDWEFYISMIEQGAVPYKIPEILFYYRKHKASCTKGISSDKKSDYFRKILRLHPQIYLDNLESCYPFFKTVYRREMKQEQISLPRRLFSVETTLKFHIIRLLGLKLKLRRR